jgi:hypothetical protein
MLRFVATAFKDIAPLGVTVLVNGAAAGSLSVPARWSLVSLPLPPTALRDGLNTIDLHYQRTVRPRDVDPSSTDDRDLALMIDRFSLEPLPVVRTIDFGSAAGRLHLLAGWSSDEPSRGRTAVWSDGPASEFVFRLPSRSESSLTFTLHAYEPTVPQIVDVAVNGQSVGKIEPGAAWGKATVPVPASTLVPGINVVSLRYDNTARPKDKRPPSNDERSLGVRIDAVDVNVR